MNTKIEQLKAARSELFRRKKDLMAQSVQIAKELREENQAVTLSVLRPLVGKSLARKGWGRKQDIVISALDIDYKRLARSLGISSGLRTLVLEQQRQGNELARLINALDERKRKILEAGLVDCFDLMAGVCNVKN